MSEKCPEKVEPSDIDNLSLSANMVSVGNLRVAVNKADDHLAAGKHQILGAFTALTHCTRDVDTRSLTVQHLEYALQELDEIPWKQLMVDIRILKGAIKRELDANGKG